MKPKWFYEEPIWNLSLCEFIYQCNSTKETTAENRQSGCIATVVHLCYDTAHLLMPVWAAGVSFAPMSSQTDPILPIPVHMGELAHSSSLPHDSWTKCCPGAHATHAVITADDGKKGKNLHLSAFCCCLHVCVLFTISLVNMCVCGGVSFAPVVGLEIG